MPAPCAPPRATFPRPISVRRADAASEASFGLSVDCPLARSEISVEECASCTNFKGVLLRSEGERSFVKCVYPSPEREGRQATLRVPPAIDARPSKASRTPVSAVMTTNVVCVAPDMPVDTLTEIFVSRRISGAPVVDDEGCPIGVVSKSDLVVDAFIRGDTDEVDTAHRDEDEELLDETLGTGSHLARFRRVCVADVMTPVVFAVNADSPLSQAAARMAAERVHRLVVSNDAGKVVGLISALDVLRWLAVQDGLI